jgi:hypothetical protein
MPDGQVHVVHLVVAGVVGAAALHLLQLLLDRAGGAAAIVDLKGKRIQDRT